MFFTILRKFTSHSAGFKPLEKEVTFNHQGNYLNKCFAMLTEKLNIWGRGPEEQKYFCDFKGNGSLKKRKKTLNHDPLRFEQNGGIILWHHDSPSNSRLYFV